jgi:chaperone BCS1
VVDQDGDGNTEIVATKLLSDKLLILPGTAADDVIADMRSFMAKREAFARYGFTHKRGYLLYGPQGTGKSSIAQQIVKAFTDDGGVVLVCRDPFYMPLGIEWMKVHEPGRGIMVLMEDPDEKHLDNSQVLAYLDGTRAVSGLVVVVTTNHKEKMTPRLANRPGRFDRVVLIDRISPVIQTAFLRELQARNPEGPQPAEELVAGLDGLPLTLAHLKEAFCAHVLLGTSIPEVRSRFEAMTAISDEPVKPTSAVEALTALLNP